MKTTVLRLKSLIREHATLTYIKKVEIVAPRILPDISDTDLPFIGIAPISTNEIWIAQRKQATHLVELYIVNRLEIEESAIVGNSVKQGLLEITNDASNAVRSNFLSQDGNAYLSKPTEVLSVGYSVTGYGDQVYLFVASISIQCTALFNTNVI